MVTFYNSEAEARADAQTLGLREKVLCFVYHGPSVLVFDHPDVPDAGVQVPAGGVEAGETPAEAARRELWEESGLTLSTPHFLAAYRWEVQLPEHPQRISSDSRPPRTPLGIRPSPEIRTFPARSARIESQKQGDSIGIFFTHQICYAFAFVAPDDLPQTWIQHADGHRFAFRWADLRQPELDWEMDAALPHLHSHLAESHALNQHAPNRSLAHD